MKTLLPLFLIAIAGALGYWVGYPIYQNLDVIKADIAEHEKALVRAERASTVLATKKSEFESVTDEDKELLNKFLPDKIDNFRWIIELNRIALRHNAKLSDIRI